MLAVEFSLDVSRSSNNHSVPETNFDWQEQASFMRDATTRLEQTMNDGFQVWCFAM